MIDANEINNNEVAVCQVIVCTKGKRGKGTENSPVRCITEVFNLQGKKIAEHDPINELFTDMDMVRFCQWWLAQDADGLIKDPKPADVYKWLTSLSANS